MTPTLSSAGPAAGPLQILGLSAVPNPGPMALALELAGPADRVEVLIYTPALVKVRTLALASGLGAGPVLCPGARRPGLHLVGGAHREAVAAAMSVEGGQ
jgi:hypothetical protein